MQVMSNDEDVIMSVARARRHLILYLLMDYCLLLNNLLYVFIWFVIPPLLAMNNLLFCLVFHFRRNNFFWLFA